MTNDALHRRTLPQTEGGLYLTDGGLETYLVFDEGIELPCFASFPLLERAQGHELLAAYFARYMKIAAENGLGFVLDTATWRANTDWGRKLGYDADNLARINRAAVTFAADLRANLANAGMPIVISAVIGPRGDGYVAGGEMSVAEARTYHAAQIDVFAGTQADMVSAITMTNVPEAIGIVEAARAAGMPVVVSFTVETDGRLPSGVDLKDAIAAVDRASDHYPAYFMVNCAHPTHFQHVLEGVWVNRLGGIRANASAKSHAELDAATSLDSGDPTELGVQYRDLRRLLPRANVLGGCCGTDHRHVAAICHSCAH
jgi:S-methylmethionine-dependent homocysteine/selenocysteine methylase